MECLVCNIHTCSLLNDPLSDGWPRSIDQKYSCNRTPSVLLQAMYWYYWRWKHGTFCSEERFVL